MAPPTAVFYPSLVVNLRIRFDGAYLAGYTEPTAQSTDDLNANPPAQGSPANNPAAVSGATDQYSKLQGLVPRSCTVELPGYRTAGTFSLELDFRDFPIDPRAVRACAAEIYLDAVKPSAFASGMTQTLQPSTLAQPRSSNLVPSQSNQLIIGICDSINVEHTDHGSYVKMEGRDYRGVFLDAKLRPGMFAGAAGSSTAPLDLKKPIDDVVSQIVNRIPYLATGQTVHVVAPPSDWPNGAPSPAVTGSLTDVRLGADGTNPTVHPGADPNQMSFWDLITQYCFLVGAVPFFYGEELRIRPARSLYDQLKIDDTLDPGSDKTVFADGAQRSIDVQNGGTIQRKHRVMVYGANIRDLKFERKLGGTKVPIIECVSVDTSNKKKGAANRLLTAQYPPESVTGIANVSPNKVATARATTATPSGNVSQADIIRVPVPGVNDLGQLTEIARHLREEIGRQELGGSCSTKDLASLGGGNSDPDLLKLRPGDAVEILTSVNGVHTNPPFLSELMRLSSADVGQLSNFIAQRIGNRQVAQVMANTLTGNGIKNHVTIFRTANVRYSWDKDSGIAIDFDFQNYVENRYDVWDSVTNYISQPSVANVLGQLQQAGSRATRSGT